MKETICLILILLLVSCDRHKDLYGHWHEYVHDSKHFYNCFKISDSITLINNENCGDLINGNYLRFSFYDSIAITKIKIEKNELILNDTITWRKQFNSKDTFISEFSAGLLVTVEPFETKERLIHKDSIEGIDHNIYLGRLKENVKPLKKEEGIIYHLQFEDKLASKEEIPRFVLGCYNSRKAPVLIHSDKSVSRSELQVLQDELLRYVNKEEIYYLAIDSDKRRSGYLKDIEKLYN